MSVILTILLTVLKIIGIALLVILGLLLLILLLVLLVPVRYDIRGVKESPKFKEAWAQGSITWLLRLIALEASYKNGVVTVLFRILTFRLKEIRIPEKESEPEGSAENDEGQQEEAAGRADPGIKETKEKKESTETEKEEPANTNTEKEEPVKSDTVETEPAKADTVIKEPVKADSAIKEPVKPEPEKKVPEKTKSEKKDPVLKTDKTKESRKQKSGKDITAKIGDLIASIPERIADLIQSVFDNLDRIDDLLYKAEKKISGLYRKAEPFISEDSRGLYMRTIHRLIRMLKHFLPKKISGYLHFGTGAPDLTGELTGLIYLVLPAGSGRFSVEPEFNDTVLETDCRVAGHIRFIHAVVFLIRTVLDKQVWRLFRTIRRSRKKAVAK